MDRLLLGVAALTLASCGTAPPYAVPHAGQEPLSVAVGEAVGRRPVEPGNVALWGVSARVVPVQAEGTTLTPPPDPDVVGWWGRKAGAAHGTTLLVGHAVHTGGGLDHLAETPVGSRIRVSGIAYRVTRVFVVSKSRLARISPKLFRQNGPPRLAVVSCAEYNWTTREWPANSVVIARPLNSSSKW